MQLDPVSAQTTVFAKTPAGQSEVQSRQLGLAPLPRRLLILVDGKRSGAELAAFVAGHDSVAMLQALLDNGCIEAIGQATPTQSPAETGAAAKEMTEEASSLEHLPPPAQRSAKELEMARHFMINTINRMLEQNSRLTLTKAIFDSRDAAELRTHFAAWEEAIGSSWMGRKRLPELRNKLFEVL